MRQFNGKKRYNDYGSFIRGHFGERVQKISLDTGFTCPNRDGTKGIGGCSYCNNNSFNPDYCKPEVSISQQLEKGIAFFSGKRGTRHFLAYFQAYTNTYADTELVKSLYREALAHPGVVGLVIGTRPDCLPDELLDYLSALSRDHFISLELGVESTSNRTLEAVNRCHTYEETMEAFERASRRGIYLGAHLILGLPGESREEMLAHADAVSSLPIDFLKLHQLQVIRQTRMAIDLKKHPEAFSLFELHEYLDLVTEFVGRLRPDITIERFISESPQHLLLAPKWGLKNFEMVALIDRLLETKGLWQGKNFQVA